MQGNQSPYLSSTFQPRPVVSVAEATVVEHRAWAALSLISWVTKLGHPFNTTLASAVYNHILSDSLCSGSQQWDENSRRQIPSSPVICWHGRNHYHKQAPKAFLFLCLSLCTVDDSAKDLFSVNCGLLIFEKSFLSSFCSAGTIQPATLSTNIYSFPIQSIYSYSWCLGIFCVFPNSK